MTTEISPMTLLERCAELSERLERVGSTEKDADLIKKLREIDDALAGHEDRAEKLKGSFAILRNGGVIKPKELDLTSANKQIQRPVETLRKRLRERRSEMTKGDTWKNLDQKAKSTTKELEAALKSAWRDFVKAETPQFEVFRSFSGFEQCRTAIQELERLKKESDEMGHDLPNDSDELTRLAEVKQEMNRAIESLDLKDVPEDVLRFLRSCSSGIRLNQLTDEILEWLRDRGFTDNLKVTLHG